MKYYDNKINNKFKTKSMTKLIITITITGVSYEINEINLLFRFFQL